MNNQIRIFFVFVFILAVPCAVVSAQEGQADKDRQIAELKEQLNSLQQIVANKESEISRLGQRSDQLIKSLDFLQNAKDKLQSDLLQIEQSMPSKMDGLKAPLEAKIEQLLQQAKTQEQLILEKEKKAADLVWKLNEIQGLMKGKENEAARLNNQVQQHIKEISDLKSLRKFSSNKKRRILQ